MEYWRVSDGRTDRRTDGHTSCHGIVRAMHTRRAVMIWFDLNTIDNEKAVKHTM